MKAALLVALVALVPAQAQVQVRFEGDRTVYTRPDADPAFNAFGIGYPPKGADRQLWYAYDPYLKRYARERGVDPVLAKAVLWNESRGRWRSTSRAGAKCVMQVMPGTAARFGGYTNVRGLGAYDPIENIEIAVKYLEFLQHRYRGNLIKISAGFNAGEGAVDKYGGVPPFAETRAYVPAVLTTWSSINSGR
jgi:soluble lytic murein transglycosylase-like protein